MKFGSFSLVLNKDEYSNIGFEFNDYDNIMLKITQKTDIRRNKLFRFFE